MRYFTLCRRLPAALLFLLCLPTWAQLTKLEVGSVYHFVNKTYRDRAMAATSPTVISSLAANADDYAQLWYVESATGGRYKLRHLGTGRYMKSAGESTPWTLVESAAETDGVYLLTVNSTYNTLSGTNSASGADKAHCAATQEYNIVGWYTSGDATAWTITKTDISAAALQENWTQLAALTPSETQITSYQAALDNLFTDKACTTLKKSFANEAALTADAYYQALPATLQDMVRKVWSGNWEEANADDSKEGWGSAYALKYRVQLYEPYNNPDNAATALGINAHTNLNNPTGLYTDCRQSAYVMVDGDIPEGAGLYIDAYQGHNNPGHVVGGVELKKGLNVVPYYVDGNNLFVNYVVETFDTSLGKGNPAKARKLTDYAPLKIHIEGGHINGYWNRVGDELYKPDTNADWDYIEARATQTDVIVLGQYETLQFPLRDEDTTNDSGATNKGLASYFNEQVKIEDCIAEWDNIVMQERLLMGLMSEETVNAANARWQSRYPDATQPHGVYTYTGNDTDNYGSDYSEYYNIHGLALGTTSGHMYGTWDHSGYNFNTMADILKGITENAGSHWGPAHEIGHQHQGPITMTGQTEVTNNLFSNMALWFYGKTNSRLEGSEASLENVLTQYYAGTTFSSYNIWAQTYMYFKLYMYYHILGHNTKFYPRLYEMLRQDPLNGKGTEIQGSEANLKFYRKVCEAAGEDLTEFFRAYGWFRVLDRYEQSDYSTSYYTQTQADIDAAINAVKAKGYAENLAVLFINDDTEGLIGSTGNTLTTFSDNVHSADLGSYDTFAANTTGSYETSVSGNTLTLTGEDGVGFIIRDENGAVVAFSDKKTFTLSDEVMAGLYDGSYTLASVSAGSKTTEIEVSPAQITKARLEVLIAQAEAIVALKADDKPFHYRSAHLIGLEDALETARTANASADLDELLSGYNLLSSALQALADDAAARVPMTPGTYTLCNSLYPTYYMSINASNALLAETEKPDDAVQQWTFEPTDEADIYYIKNASTGTYVESVARSTQVSATQPTTANAARYKVIDFGGGLVSLQNQSSTDNYLHCASGKEIVGWYNNASDKATRWTLTATALDEDYAAREALLAIVTRTNILLGKMGDGMTHCMDALQTTDAAAPFYLSSNADQNVVGNSTDGGGTAALLDGDAETYFHSQWGGTAVADDHYLQVDLGEARAFSEFLFSYATRKATSDNYTSPAPATIVVSGSNDGATFTTLATYSSGDADNPLPSYTELGKVWTSPVVTSDTPYRYLRFTVTRSAGPGATQYGGHYFFGLGEFDLWGTEGTAASLQDKYAGAETAFADADKAAFEGELTYNNASATTAEVEAATAKAQAAYDELLKHYKRSSLPVRITTDPANPILYRIATKRDGFPAFKFDPDDSMVAVATFAPNNTQFAWYFMDGTEVGKQVRIYPYYGDNTTRVLGSNTIEEGREKVCAAELGSEGYVQEWSFVERPGTPGYFNLTCRNANNEVFYLSNWGGIYSKMGFYNSNPDTDGGSLFSFTPIRTDMPESFVELYSLREFYTQSELLTPTDLTGGYNAEALESLKPAARVASEAASDFFLADEVYDAALANLQTAIAGYNKPKAGRLYTLTSASAYNNNEGNAIKGRRIYATTSNEMRYDTKAATDASALWQLTPVEGEPDGYTLTNLQTGCSLNVEYTDGQTAFTLGETDAKTVTLTLLNTTRQFNLTPSNSRNLNAHPNGKVVAYNDGTNTSSAWVLDEADAADIVQDVTISQYGYAGLHLNYPVEIPDGVTAYIVTQAPISGEVTLEALDGVIPANTGVILHSPDVEAAAEAASLPFHYAAEAADEATGNRLLGSNYRRTVKGEPDTNYYLFGAKTLDGGTSKTVGLYRAWLQYSADGTIADGNANTDNGGWFQVSAGKIYLPVTTASGAPAAQFTFTFGNPTGIDSVAGTAAAAVYDLQGRRIGRIAKPGIYVVNGQKKIMKP